MTMQSAAVSWLPERVDDVRYYEPKNTEIHTRTYTKAVVYGLLTLETE